MDIDRDYYIEILTQFNTNKAREYFEKLTDRELIENYERLMRLD